MNKMKVLLACFLATLVVSQADAQNVTGYENFPNPYLLLIREPAVQDDLKLSSEQHSSLQRVNDSVDGRFLSMRNKSGDVAGKIFTEVMEATTSGLSDVLSSAQQTRIQQIRRQVRGVSSVLLNDVKSDLALTDDQAREIQDIIKSAQGEVAELKKQFQQGEGSSAAISKKINSARQAEYRDVVSKLSTAQKRTYARLLGPRFDTSKLGHVKFKAPDFVESGGWVNSNQPLKLAQFRGKVVALHFFAFG